MVKFRFGTTELTFGNFSKHHRQLPQLIGRRMSDGTYINYIKSPDFQKDVDANPDKIIENKASAFINNKIELITECYVLFDNQEYIEADIPYYSVGAVNTRQTMYGRIRFQFERATAFIDFSARSEGTYASNFGDIISHHSMRSFLKELIEEKMEQSDDIDETGVVFMDDNSSNLSILVNDNEGRIVDIEVTLSELANALVSIEMYKFDMEIVDDTEEEEQGEEE